MKALSWEQYKELAFKTVSDVDTDYFTHACMGIATEAIELVFSNGDENYKEETGDVWWYIALLANSFEIDGEHRKHIDQIVEYANIKKMMEVSQVSTDSFLCAAGAILDQAKRRKYYGSLSIKTLTDNLLKVCVFLSKNSNAIGYPTPRAWYDNIEKLKKRFPDKFTTESALNRDTENELSHIENGEG